MIQSFAISLNQSAATRPHSLTKNILLLHDVSFPVTQRDPIRRCNSSVPSERLGRLSGGSQIQRREIIYLGT